MADALGAAMEDLIEGLTMAGLAMQVAHSSRPASGAEHYFSLLWELEGPAHGADGARRRPTASRSGSCPWPALREQVMTPDELSDRLGAAGCPSMSRSASLPAATGRADFARPARGLRAQPVTATI